MVCRINATIPDELKQRLDTWEKDNPTKKINLSGLLQLALDEELKKDGY